MKQKTKYPKAAKAIGGVALFLIVLGFKAPALFVLGGFLGLVAIILALGPDNHPTIDLADDDNLNPHKTGFVFENGRYVTEAEAGYSYF